MHDDISMTRVQTSIATYFFREVDALTLAAKYMPNLESPRILSFGCSIGDELATLKSCFPNAQIFGCDTEEFALRQATATFGHFATVFVSNPKNIALHGPYDLICAFSSLCVNPFPGKDEMAKRFSFSHFEDLVGLLDKNLVDRGIICFRNTTYLFPTTATARQYVRIRSRVALSNGFIPIVHPSGDLALYPVRSEAARVFEILNIDGLDDWDFIDSVFQKTSGVSNTQAVILNEDAQWTRPTGQYEQIARWTRTNLDFLTQNVLNLNLLVTGDTWDMSQTVDRPGEILVERQSFRKSLRSSDHIEAPLAGSWKASTTHKTDQK